MNDATVTPALAEQLTQVGHAELAPVLGVLAGWADACAKKALDRVPKHWRRLSEAGLTARCL